MAAESEAESEFDVDVRESTSVSTGSLISNGVFLVVLEAVALSIPSVFLEGKNTSKQASTFVVWMALGDLTAFFGMGKQASFLGSKSRGALDYS